MQIRQINLPVSLHLLETYGSYAPSRFCSTSECFIFEITLPSLSLSRISFSGRSRSVLHRAVIKVVFFHYLIFIQVSNLFWCSCIISSSDVSFCKGCSNKLLTKESYRFLPYFALHIRTGALFNLHGLIYCSPFLYLL